MAQSMINRWNYEDGREVQYGELESYRVACRWLDDVHGTVADLGCGTGFARRFLPNSLYMGVDGSQNDYASICGVDLRTYVGKFDCVLLRHVLDHNTEWRQILENAITTFQKRMALVFFRPFGPKTRVVSVSQCPLYSGVPDLEFCRADFIPIIGPWVRSEIEIGRRGNTALVDTIFLMEKPACVLPSPPTQPAGLNPSAN